MCSTQPPWSMAQSTITEPVRIDRTIASVTTIGARPPGTSTAPITRSASATARSTARRLLASVMMRPLWIWSTQRRRSRFLSSRSTSASMPCAIHAAFQPDVAGAEHHDARGSHAGRAAEQHAASAVLAFEEVRAHLRRHAAGDLAHRCEQRERARLHLHGLVGDAGDAVLEQRVGDLRVRGQVEVGEEHEARAEEVELLGLGLLDLQHEVGARPHVVGGRRRSRLRRRGSRRR